MQNVEPLPLKTVHMTEGLLKRMQALVKERVLTYQWEVLNDRVEGAARSHCIENFRIAARLSEGERYGVVFLDTDLYKWLEAVAYCLEAYPDAQLEARADEVCELIAKAQEPDGYINTYYTLVEPAGRFKNLQQGHELYCAGHFFEAAAAYYRATGKRAILDTACRFADYLVKVFGTGEGKIPGYPGHQEVEVGLVKLYRATGNRAYLALADYFIAQRGKKPLYFVEERSRPGYREIYPQPFLKQPTYAQYHQEPIHQEEAVGHAVRAMYMYSAMADLAMLTENPALNEACLSLYRSVTQRRMYVTGGIGSTEYGESFTVDYDLPNDTCYCESCASVGLMMFASRMARLTGDGAYYDTVERAFFNQVLGGISQTGTEFFYVGPLAVNPSACHGSPGLTHVEPVDITFRLDDRTVNPSACHGNPGLAHVKPVRQKWFDVACCPTNIARTIMSIGGYAFGATDDTLFIHIPLASEIDTGRFKARLETQYPFGDSLRIHVQGQKLNLAVRQGALAPIRNAMVNGEARPLTVANGYLMLPDLGPGDVVDVAYDLTPRYVVSHPSVVSNVGKAAVMRGPLVYCAEQADNGQGIACLRLPGIPAFSESEAFAGGGAVRLTTRGARAVFSGGEALYQDRLPDWEEADLHLIPYFLWANRGEGEMQVYLNVQSCTGRA